MTTGTVRAIIAIAMVAVFIGLTLFMALFPLLSSRNVEIPDYADYFVKIVSVYTGILGVIIGYYFGRTEHRAEKDSSVGGSLSSAETTARG